VLDGVLKARIDPAADRIARPLAARGVSANAMTAAGAAFSLGAGAALAAGRHLLALALFLMGRFCDGLDGALARIRGKTDLGGALDIVADFVGYAAIPLGFALAEPTLALPAAVLLAAFTVNGASFLAVAAAQAGRGRRSTYAGSKSLYYSAGLMEGTETIAFFVVMLVAPAWFAPLAYAFAALCAATTAARLAVFASESRADAGAIVLLDSISHVGPRHAGAIVVTGSHGGEAAVGFVAEVAVAALVFNDAGGGKDGAGVAALDALAARGLPAVAVAHTSARIGEAAETLAGVVSDANAPAREAGVVVGMAAGEAVERLRGQPLAAT
jgi:phosphatidylglycerophosphate synthase